jgi:Type II restriction enzyme MunI
MGDALRNRLNWQNLSGAKAGVAENNFYTAFTTVFKDTDYQIRAKPTELKNIYVDVELSPEVQALTYNPGVTYKHGVIPDFAIDNKVTRKTLYVEVKRQDGWVEEKLPSAGRGNAHERSNKFFTPGLLKVLRKFGKIAEPALPFWTVFQGDIARDPKRTREIHLWYDTYQDHFFLWRDSADVESVVRHFDTKLKHLLD